MADVSRVGVFGPLGPFVAGFAAELSRQRYKPQPVGKQIGLLTALSGWRRPTVGCGGCRRTRSVSVRCGRAARHTDRVTVRALDPLLKYLRGLGVAPSASSPAPAGAVEELLWSFGRYLEHERGLVRSLPFTWVIR